MKNILLLLAVLVITACGTVKEKDAAVSSFNCELSIEEFNEKVAGISSLGGFYVVSSDTANNNLIVILQKLISRKGTSESLVVLSDQIRLRYSMIDKTVWVSHGVLTETAKRTKFKAPEESDVKRHSAAVFLTIDRVFMLCNPGKMPPLRD